MCLRAGTAGEYGADISQILRFLRALRRWRWGHVIIHWQEGQNALSYIHAALDDFSFTTMIVSTNR